MKLIINREALADIVTRGTSCAPKNSPHIVANNARLTVENGTLSIASSDFITMVEASGDCQSSSDGVTTVEAAKLKAVVDRLPKGADVKLVYNDDKREIVLGCGRSQTRFPTLSPEDWPAREMKYEGATFTLAGADLVKLFGFTAQALSTMPDNPMSGVFFHVRETPNRPLLAAVGTTGMILIMATVGMPEGAENMPHRDGHPPGVILSAETVNAVLRLFRTADEVEIVVNRSSINFSTGNVRYCSAMIDGTYPNYGPLVNAPVEERVIVSRVAAHSTVSLLEPFALKEQGYRLQCATSEEGFVVAVGSQTGGGVDVVEAEVDGEVKPFGLNGQFLKTMLSSFKSEKVALHPDATTRRVMFKAEDDPDLVGVIAMMNIDTSMAEAPKHG